MKDGHGRPGKVACPLWTLVRMHDQAATPLVARPIVVRQ
jgi:hypothetical protein